MTVKFFLDSSTLFAAVSMRKAESVFALSVLLQNRIPMFTNEYVIKEIRRVMIDLGYAPENLERFIDLIRKRVTVVKAPSKEEFSKMRLRDRSDAPIVASAEKLGCILVTEDNRLRLDAGSHAPSISSEEAVRLFGIKRVKGF